MLIAKVIITKLHYNIKNFQTNGVTIKTETSNDKSDKAADGNVNNVTIKQEPVDPTNSDMTNGGLQGHADIKTEIKQENMKPPPEKKPRL